ncbi:MAG: ATP-binding protein [Pyrinomonadaceae bacterium]
MNFAAEMSQNEQFPKSVETVFGHLFELYGVLDDSGRIIEIAGPIFERTNLEPRLLHSQVFSETAFWQSSDANSKAVTTALKNTLKGNFSRVEVEFRVSSKEKIPLELNLIPAENDGRIYICARQTAEIAEKGIIESDPAAQLLLAAESAKIGLWYLSFAEDKIRATAQFSEILGLERRKELTFSAFLETVHADDRDSVRKFLSSTIRAGDRYEQEFRIVSADGNIDWISAEGKSFLGQNGKPERMVGAVRKITEEKRAAEELESVYEREKAARDEAEEANRSKDIFLAFVSHELRAPLNSILGWSNILLTKEVDENTRRKALETIERSARMQTKLINDLVDSARVASGKIRLEYRPTDIFSVVRNVVDALRPSLESRGLNYETNIAPDKAYVMGDVNRLQQVFGNLLSNAIKFTPPGGNVTISAKKTGLQVEVVISDSGEGISASSLPTIFKQFSQVGAGERKSVGLGLGLSIAKTLVERHGGTVHAESDGVGKGSRFVVLLPILDSSKLELTTGGLQAPISQKLLAGLTILIVEDEMDSREVLRLYLENKGATVYHAENVAAGLRILESLDAPPNLIVSDIGMPEEDGLSMIRRIRSSENSSIAGVPAIALSAFATGEFKTSALESGFQRYVAKPFDPKSFAQTIIEVARRT